MDIWAFVTDYLWRVVVSVLGIPAAILGFLNVVIYFVGRDEWKEQFRRLVWRRGVPFVILLTAAQAHAAYQMIHARQKIVDDLTQRLAAKEAKVRTAQTLSDLYADGAGVRKRILDETCSPAAITAADKWSEQASRTLESSLGRVQATTFANVDEATAVWIPYQANGCPKVYKRINGQLGVLEMFMRDVAQ
jgi:hypothetical protein